MNKELVFYHPEWNKILIEDEFRLSLFCLRWEIELDGYILLGEL